MVKRSSQDSEGAAAFRKRQRITQDVPVGEEITSSEQLRRLLTFDQNLRNARHGLQSAKSFLDNIVSNNDDRETRLGLLQEYLSAIEPRQRGDDAVYLSEVMDMWSFAIQANDEGVMSAVAVVLDLFLQVLSSSLHLVPYGGKICRTLLQEPQLKSLSRNLSSERAKAFIISPTLRLLREMVCFDGGILAKRVVRERAYTFACLSRNLELGHTGETPEESRKASIRTNAVKFFLSCLKFIHSDGRKELLLQKDLLTHLTYMMKNDPVELVLEIMDSLKSYVVLDHKIPRDIKSKTINIKMLMRLLSLYTYSSATASNEEQGLVSDKAHELLTLACTNPNGGVLYPYKGLYPKEADNEFSASFAKEGRSSDIVDPWDGKSHHGARVYNFTLLEFTGKLRPWSSLRHCELLVAIFTAAPELISNYFYNNRSFTFEPKLSMTWIGYASFLFSTMMIPLPASFGDPVRYAVMPPPSSIVLDNIIPRPLNEKILVRCFANQSHLTSFFATRMLVAALDKLSTALELLSRQTDPNTGLWADARRRIKDAFCQRIPGMKDIVHCYKNVPADNVLQRTLTSRLLRLYYEVVPQIALSANFDVSPFFVEALNNLQKDDVEAEHQKLGFLEMENLVSIASYSPGMRWFAKLAPLAGGQEPSSPFIALLRLLCADENGGLSDELQSVLEDVAVESQVLQDTSALGPLLQVLRCFDNAADVDGRTTVWSFLDNCICRCAASPIKYVDLMKNYLPRGDAPEPASGLSLVHVVILEQLPYALNNGNNQTASHLAAFVSLCANAVLLSHNSSQSLTSYHSDLEKQFASTSTALVSLGDGKQIKALKNFASDRTRAPDTTSSETISHKQLLDQDALKDLLDAPLLSADDAAVLSKWPSKSIEDVIDDGWAASLVRLLRSPHTNLRKESLTNILKMAAQLKESSYEEKMQVWLLLSEVAESSRPHVDGGPVPSAFVAFTIHALDVLKDPLHPLYPKVNAYLTRSPVWGPDKLPLAHDILHGTPSEDDKVYTELAWLLEYLLDSLNGPTDLDIFHKKRWFEKVLAVGSNPYLRSGLRSRLLKLIYRATCIEAGSTTLTTRFGILSWLDSQRAVTPVEDDKALYRGLMVRVWQTCDRDRVHAWSNGGARQLLARIGEDTPGTET